MGRLMAKGNNWHLSVRMWPVGRLLWMTIIMRMIIIMSIVMMNIMRTVMALAQIPISTFSHIWVFVRQYGIMFVIIVIVIIIIIIIQKSKSINTEACLIAH